MKQRIFIASLALVILLIGPMALAGVGFGDFNSGAPAQSADIHLVGRSCTINGSPGYCTRQETNADLNTYMQAHAPGTSGQILFNSGGTMTTDTAANMRTKLGLGTAGVKAASDNTKATVASVSGSTAAGHVCTFADTAGTVQDGGALVASVAGRTGAVTLSTSDIGGYTAPVNADWNAVSGLAQILNKPTLGTAAAKAASGSGGTVASVTGTFTAGHAASFADTSGTVQDAGAFNAGLVGLGNVTNTAQMPLSYLDTDNTLAANSDVRVASQKAVKAYIDGHTGAALSGLSDVALGTLSDKDVLKYDNATGKWKNGTIAKSEVGLGNVENTALSTWAGSMNLTTLGTVGNGTWHGSTVGLGYGGTNAGTAAGALANLGAAPAVLAINTQTASYTLVLGDALGSSGAGGAVLMNVGSANNLTVPPHSSVAWLVGTQVIVCQKGAGQTTIVAGAGVTINTGAATKKLRAQYSCVTLFEDAQDDWYLSGDLAAS